MLTLTQQIQIKDKSITTVNRDVLNKASVPNTNVVSHPTWRFKDVKLNSRQQELFAQALDTLTQMRKFAIHYLEHTYGRKHLKCSFPTSQVDKAALATKIAGLWFNQANYADEHAGKRWNKKLANVHSLSAQRNLIALITNFGIYRQHLKQTLLNGKLLDRKRYYYDQKGNNPKHHKAVHASSLSYRKLARALMFPTSGSMKPYVQIISNHCLTLPDYGKIFVKENLKSMRKRPIKMITLISQSNGRIDVHLTFERNLSRQKHHLRVNALDWNLTNRQPYTDIYNQGKPLPKPLVKHLLEIDAKEDRDRQRLSYLRHHTSHSNRAYQRVQAHLNKVSAKRSAVLDNYYVKYANALAQAWPYLAVESLDYNQMVQERAKQNQNKANHRVMMIKPARLYSLLVQAFNRHGHTICSVDCYKTSQMIYASDYHYEKHPTKDRKWYSDYVKRLIRRDQNAACNILYWSIFPEQHAKIHDRKLKNQQLQQAGKALLPELPAKLMRTFN